MTAFPPPGLILRPHGRVGNHLLQWFTGQTLVAAVPRLTLHNYALPLWGLGGGRIRRNHPFVPSITTQDINLHRVADLMRSGEMPLARLRCMVLQADMWGDPKRFRRHLPLSGQAVETAGPDEILLNVRADEILKARSPDYGPVPIGFYVAVLRKTGLRPVFMGQLGDNGYSRLLRDSFPDARFLPSQGVLGDFEAMRQARHLALSVSTFSWAAAWLSEAESLHMPLLGFYNPAQRPDINLMPQEDDRFCYYGFAPRYWTASETQIAALSDMEAAPLLTRGEADGIRKAARAARAKARVEDMRLLEARARMSLRFMPVLRRIYDIR